MQRLQGGGIGGVGMANGIAKKAAASMLLCTGCIVLSLFAAGVVDAELGEMDRDVFLIFFRTPPQSFKAKIFLLLVPVSILGFLAVNPELAGIKFSTKTLIIIGITFSVWQTAVVVVSETAELHPGDTPSVFFQANASRGERILPCDRWNRSGTGPCILNQPIPQARLDASRYRKIYRLGNILDRWWSAGICGMIERKGMSLTKNETEKQAEMWGEFRWMLKTAPKGSFAKFLATHPPDIPVEYNITAITNRQKSPYWTRHNWWWLYFYDAIREVHDGFRHAVRQAVEEYVLETGTRVPMYDAHTCVVHYRLGDMAQIGTLDPKAMAREFAGWTERFNLTVREVHVLGGGNLRHSSSGDDMMVSQNILISFVKDVQALMGGVTVYVDPNGQPDEDFIKMVSAPMLFTATGSYATAALIANTGHRASPAVKNLNFPGHGAIPAAEYLPRWWVYDIELCKLEEYRGRWTKKESIDWRGRR